MDEIQRDIIQVLLQKGNRVKPRKRWIYEINGLGFKLNNPRARLIYNPERKYSLSLAFGELLWYLRGTNRLDIIQYYNRRYPQFSDDGLTLYGAYGPRIFGDKHYNSLNQWEWVVNKLKEDPDTRQAIISIYAAKDITVKTLDVPCTCYIQFFIRDDKLNCIVSMRSNDIIWGTSYDVFSFTMLQELMATQLQLEVGWYMHFAGSMHIYDRHLTMAEKMLAKKDYEKYSMPVMPENAESVLPTVYKAEEELRLNGYTSQRLEDDYWNDIIKVLDVYSKVNRLDRDSVKKDIALIPEYYQNILAVEKQVRDLI